MIKKFAVTFLALLSLTCGGRAELRIDITGINLVGITVVLWGFVVATLEFIRMKLKRETLGVL